MSEPRPLYITDEELKSVQDELLLHPWEVACELARARKRIVELTRKLAMLQAVINGEVDEVKL